MEPESGTSIVRKRGRPRKDGSSHITENSTVPDSISASIPSEAPSEAMTSNELNDKQDTNPETPKRGRGRPPKAKTDTASSSLNDTSGSEQPGPISTKNQILSQLPTQKRRGRPPKSMVASPSSDPTLQQTVTNSREKFKKEANINDSGNSERATGPSNQLNRNPEQPLTQKRRGRPPKTHGLLSSRSSSPRKIKTATDTIKRGRGRPSKNTTVGTPRTGSSFSLNIMRSISESTLQVIRNRGRPRTDSSSATPVPKRKSATAQIKNLPEPTVQAKRGRGRPSKNTNVATPKAGRTSVLKVVSTSESALRASRKRVRPCKDSTAATPGPKRTSMPAKVKNTSESTLQASRKRGRQRKDSNAATPTRKRGRPCLNQSMNVPGIYKPQVVKKRGRPLLTHTMDVPGNSKPQASRKRGRPRKDSNAATPTRKRPSLKQSTDLADSSKPQKRGRGRPQNIFFQYNDVSGLMEVPDDDDDVIERKRVRPAKNMLNTTKDRSPSIKRSKISSKDAQSPEMITESPENPSSSAQPVSIKRGRGRPCKNTNVATPVAGNPSVIANKRGRPSLKNNEAEQLVETSSRDGQLEASSTSSTTSSNRSGASIRLNSNFATYVIAVPMNELKQPPFVDRAEAVQQLHHMYSLVDDDRIPEFHRRLQSVAFQIIENDSSFVRVSSPRT